MKAGVLLIVLLLVSSLSYTVLAARDPFEKGDVQSLNVNSNRVALHTPYGKIVFRLLPDNAPNTVSAIKALAQNPDACNDKESCMFYRAESRPDPEKGEPEGGPPYALLQGSLRDLHEIPESEGDMEVKSGHVAFIPKTKDFFIALNDHPEWGTAHTVFAEVEDFVSTDLIAIQPYHEETHEKYGTVMRLMNDPVYFKVDDNADAIL